MSLAPWVGNESSYSANMLLSAMLIALIYQTTKQSSTLYAAEVFIILTFGNGSSFISTFAVQKPGGFFAPKYDNMTGTTLLGITTRLHIDAGFQGYMLWFWFVGIEDMVIPNAGDCMSYGWMFARVRLLGWFRTFNKAMAIMGAAGCALSILRGLAMIANSTRRNGWRWIGGRMLDSLTDQRDEIRDIAKMALHIASRNHRTGLVIESDIAEAQSRIARGRNVSDGSQESLQSLPELGRSATIRRVLSPSNPHPPLPSRRWVLVAYLYLSNVAPWVYDFVFLPVFIATIEMTIRYNDIRGVNSFGSTGQLIPLVIGVAGIVKVWIEWAKRERKRRQRKRRQAREERAQDDRGDGEVVQNDPETISRGEGVP